MMADNSVTKNRGTFLIDIYNRQNATWQGTVTWINRDEKQHFRSALELIKMIDNALEEAEGGSHEE
ncbi:MAG TPA: hypothetical protein IAB52_02965 [Candidatus Scatomonas merdavium]|nr:hypothetical protein [Candidatus Scatomonas merdavium]